MRKFLCALFFLLLSAFPSLAAEIDFPALSGQVVDEAGVLTPEKKAQILRILSADKDNQVAVAIVRDLRGLTGREYGIELARRWQLGQKGKDNGVLILISPKDKYAGIEVGYGLENVLPDSLSGRILREIMFPSLRQNQDYGQAALNGAAAVMMVLNNGKLKLADQSESETSPMEDALSALLTLIMVYLVLTGRWHPGGGRGFLIGRSGGGGGRFWGGGGGFGGGGAGGRF